LSTNTAPFQEGGIVFFKDVGHVYQIRLFKLSACSVRFCFFPCRKSSKKRKKQLSGSLPCRFHPCIVGIAPSVPRRALPADMEKRIPLAGRGIAGALPKPASADDLPGAFI